MILETFGPTVKNAYFINSTLPQLVINTNYKNIHPEWSESGDLPPTGNCYLYFEYNDGSSVRLTSEDDEESKILHHQRFESHVKDQLIIIFVHDDYLVSKKL